MKTSIAAAVILTASAVTAFSEPSFTVSPLAPQLLSDGSTFYGWLDNFSYLPSEGDTPVLRMHGFEGLQVVGLPPFLREVPTEDGRLLRGTPQPGTYVVHMYKGGVLMPTLEMTMRFIPR